MIVISEPKLWRCHAESIDDMAAWLAATPRRWSANCATNSEPSGSWDLGAGYEGVQRLAREGWSAGALDLSSKLSARLPPNERMNKWRYDMAGELPDVARHLSGIPSAMMRRGTDHGRRPVIAIHVNVWIRCDVRAQHMANYGAAMVAAIDQIEQAGRRVELTAGVTAPNTQDSKTIMSATWTVKRAEDPVDFGSLAFSLAHPGASRRFGWAAWERSDKTSDRGFGLGGGYVAKESDLIDPVANTLILNGLNSNPHRCSTIEDAIQFVRDQVNTAAGEVLIEAE